MKSVAHRDLLEGILRGIVEAPTREADPHVRVEAIEALPKLETLSDAELFDIIQRVGDAEPHCEVSPFMHTLCNLTPFYERPASPSGGLANGE